MFSLCEYSISTAVEAISTHPTLHASGVTRDLDSHEVDVFSLCVYAMFCGLQRACK
jgi:hypothetical protein